MSGPLLAVAGGWVLRVAGVMLVLVALRLARRAHELGVEPEHAAWLAPLALVVGWFKARRVMGPLLERNVDDLSARERVPAWRLYPPRLMVFIVMMVVLSALAKRLAAGCGMGLATLSALDLAVGTALLLASLPVLRRARARA